MVSMGRRLSQRRDTLITTPYHTLFTAICVPDDSIYEALFDILEGPIDLIKRFFSIAPDEGKSAFWM
jgi:hypothetical protein